MIYSNLKKRTGVLFLVILVVLLAFSAGCVQQAPVENVTNVTGTPTEVIPDSTVTQTPPEMTATQTSQLRPTENQTSSQRVTDTQTPHEPTAIQTVTKTTLSENDQLYVKSMEDRLKKMYEELDRRETEMGNTIQEIKRGLVLSRETLDFIETAHDKGYDYSHVVEKIKVDVTTPKKKPDGTSEYWELTPYGRTVLNKLESYEEGISQQKDEIVIQKRRINDFYKGKGLPAPYNAEVI